MVVTGSSSSHSDRERQTRPDQGQMARERGDRLRQGRPETQRRTRTGTEQAGTDRQRQAKTPRCRHEADSQRPTETDRQRDMDRGLRSQLLDQQVSRQSQPARDAEQSQWGRHRETG